MASASSIGLHPPLADQHQFAGREQLRASSKEFREDVIEVTHGVPADRAEKMLDMVGGVHNMLTRAREAFQVGEFQWAAELADYVLAVDAGNRDAEHLKAAALTELGERQVNATARNYYLTSAQFLLQDQPDHTPRDRSEAEMLVNRSMPSCDVIPELAYPDVTVAVAWLVDVFDFKLRLRIGQHRAQLEVGGGAVVVMQLAADGPARLAPAYSATHAVMVRVPDVDAHYTHAVARGAPILRPPEDFPYGERQYSVRDLAGHTWTFSQSIADVAPETWGGERA